MDTAGIRSSLITQTQFLYSMHIKIITITITLLYLQEPLLIKPIHTYF